VALVLYFGHSFAFRFMGSVSQVTAYGFHTLFLAVFIAFAWFFERNNKVLFSPS
jgi:hypothetical protein